MISVISVNLTKSVNQQSECPTACVVQKEKSYQQYQIALNQAVPALQNHPDELYSLSMQQPAQVVFPVAAPVMAIHCSKVQVLLWEHTHFEGKNAVTLIPSTAQRQKFLEEHKLQALHGNGRFYLIDGLKDLRRKVDSAWKIQKNGGSYNSLSSMAGKWRKLSEIGK
ncbi:hypothetical protein RB195_017846 [Necator americanus]|uniref:Uncharacterized protein n=1 Tax=Necator americanus TaxID=51031 RepID=A0ABR1C949_NECAM